MKVLTKRLIDSFHAKWRARRLARRIARARRNPTVEGITRLAIRLIAASRLDEAEALVQTGLAHAPDSPELVEQLAFCAHNAGRYREALERWRRLGAMRPDLPMAWCGMAANARELQRLGEAAAAADEALRRFPDDVVVLTEAARVREACGAHEDAVELWRRALPQLCADERWPLSLAGNLIALDRFDEAQAVLDALQAPDERGSAAARRKMARYWCDMAFGAAHPDRARFVRYVAEAVPRFGEEAYAITHVAETTSDLVAAAAVLEALLARAPSDIEARESYVRILVRGDRLDEAARQVSVAVSLAPDRETLVFLQGLIAIRGQDWEAALAFATAHAQKNPNDLTATYMLDRVRRVRQLEQAEGTRDAARLVPIAPALCDRPEDRQLLLAFESIGEDCEFGTVQRRYGAEPLGLLRWTETDIPSLTAALAAGFEGVGDPQNTELVIGHAGEIQIRDRRWNLAMHTFLYESEVSMAVLRPKMCRRTAYLRDKLLEELRTGRKTLVFKTDLADTGDLLALHDALLAYGPNRLLNVRHASGALDVPPGAPGSVDEIRPGLFIGHLSSLANLADIAYDEWVEVCRGVERLRTMPVVEPPPGMASAA